MIIDQAPIEYVFHIQDDYQVQLLQSHFDLFYKKLAEQKGSAQKKTDGVQRYLSGMPNHNFNIILGCPTPESDSDQCIKEQLAYFAEQGVSFIWYVNEDASPSFKEKLIKYGFVDEGIFQGVIGALETPIAPTSIPEGYTLESVKDEASMQEFNELVCNVFGIKGAARDIYKNFLWKMANQDAPRMFHWMVRKNGKAVSTVSTMIQEGVCSFWNGASISDERKQGLNTGLRRFALQDAMKRGCRFGTSYLRSDCPAFGICKKLGYQTKWNIHAYHSPTNTKNKEV